MRVSHPKSGGGKPHTTDASKTGDNALKEAGDHDGVLSAGDR